MYNNGESTRRWERIKVRQAYDSDISKEQFVAISQELESAKKKTRPRKVDLYEIFNFFGADNREETDEKDEWTSFTICYNSFRNERKGAPTCAKNL
jgi:hypothetical protein